MKPVGAILIGVLLGVSLASLGQAERPLKAGIGIRDISPTNFPVLVNAMFTERTGTKVVDPLNARALVLEGGETKIAICVVDSCMLPRELLDRAKKMVEEAAHIPSDHIMISATHTHSAPSAMGCLGSRADSNYVAFLPARIADAIIQANSRLVPARIGWAVTNDWKHTFNRRWIRRPDKMLTDPFGQQNVRAHMHPGHESPDVTGPSGPVDPALSIIAVQTVSGRPLALFANYSQHYYESPLLSSDYYGRFANHVATMLNATNSEAPFLAMMSQGTSGDQMWMDYGAPRQEIGYDAYARELADEAVKLYSTIKFHDSAPLAMDETTLKLNFRTPDDARLEWAREMAARLGERLPQSLPEVYALEAIHLHERPVAELILQAIRIGDLGIATIPNEVFGATGLKIKGRSPFETTINIELANGAEGYIPPPEQHKLGGYTTWPARTAGLEELAEPKIVDELVDLLEIVADKGQRQIVAGDGAYTKTILDAKPAAYWRLDDLQYFPIAADSSPNGHPAKFEDGVALYLPGVGSGTGISPHPELTPSNFSASNEINRAVHFAGGRVRANVPKLSKTYSAEMWFWSGLPNNAREVTGYFFSRGKDGDREANGDQLGIGGTHKSGAEGRLIFFNGNKANELLVGRTTIQPRTWHYVAMVREGDRVTVYLDGKTEPEISGKIASTVPADSTQLFLGGRNDGFSGLEGKLDEVAVYDRALSAEEAAAHFKTGGIKVEATAATHKRASDPLSPEESLKKIHVSAGFRAELVAAEPLVLDPVAIDWDTAGRMWVVEMADYPLGMDGKGKPGGRIRILEDANGDGVYDKSHLFADGLNYPTGLITWRDGVIVTAAPEIIFLRDTDGDGRADVREVLFSGFLEGNQQLRINGLRWGLDNWIYCAVGGHYRGYGAATKIKSHLTGQEIALGSRDFRFRPDTGEFEPESGPAQFGRNRDDWGHWFGTQNSNPLWHYVLADRYIRRNPHVAAPDPTHQVFTPLNPPVFPVSAPEKRYHSFEHKSHFTSGCSGTIYRDTLFFPANEIHGFACEPFHNLVHHEILSDDGVTFSARRTPAEQTSEFFASEDSWTRPVMVRTGPDGALYVVDMYRYMIEHPDWLPAEGKEELLPFYREGDDKGRIYRVLPEVRRRRSARAALDKIAIPDLVKALDSTNEYQRDKTQQLLLWRNEKTAIQPLKDLAERATNALGRLHALCTLDGLNALTPDLLEPAIRDASPGLRENAVRLAEMHFTLITLALADDPSPKVRLQLACSLGEWKSREAGEALAKIAARDHDNPFMVAAVMSSAIPHLDVLASRLEGEALQPFSEPLFATALGVNRRDIVHRLLKPVFDGNQFANYSAFLDLLKRRNSSVESLIKADASDDLGKLLARQSILILHGMQTVADSSAPASARFDGLELMTHDPGYQQTATRTLRLYLNPSNGIDLQRKAIDAIANTAAATVPSLLLSNWSSHTPETKSACLEAIFRREAWTYDLTQQIESGAIPAADLDAARRNRLLKHNSKRIADLAAKIFSQSANSSRAKIVDEFRPALQLTGNIAHGKELFAKLCSACHQRDGVGNQIGPDLKSVAEHPPEKILANILDPNADIQPGFNVYNCGLTNGEELYGLISSETATSVLFKFADGTTRKINRTEINTLRSSNLSLMPEGLEQGLAKQDLADLIAFVRSH